ncbi:hypothetical protein [Pseudomonas putida]|uniref:Uncharacterized protein n=1 Tax=Pseudomonas putida TaxID=303 RepID=A0A1L5PN87_PSEPU|nr:hypothetical protein [Pseudomonas putida]APO81634.1 hypothetical protein BL240_09320 [Pseudomonas putida]
MDTNKMREQFESAWRARYPEHGEIALKRSGLAPEDYCNTRVKDAWWAWQASREAVVVELPSEDTCRTSTSKEEAVQEAYNHALGECRAAIEAQGLKVEP